MLYALGADLGRISLWVEDGKLSLEYNLFEIERTRLGYDRSAPDRKGQDRSRNTRDQQRTAPVLSTSSSACDGKEVATGPRASLNLARVYLPMTLLTSAVTAIRRSRSRHFDRKPFAFNGKINRLRVEYLN